MSIVLNIPNKADISLDTSFLSVHWDIALKNGYHFVLISADIL